MIGKLQSSTISKSQGTNMMNKLGWITNTKSGQRSNPFLKSKNLNEEGCLQWRCTLWKPLSGQPLEKTLWIKAKDLSDYSGKDGIIGANVWIITNDFHSIEKGIYDRHFSHLWIKHYPLKFVTNFSHGSMKLIEKHNACCILFENHNACCICLKITTLAAFLSCSSFSMWISTTCYE